MKEILILDCENYNSLILSLEAIFNASGKDMISFLQKIDLKQICLNNREAKDYYEILFDEFIKEFKLDDSKIIYANWFHNTRTLKDSEFSEGILPSQKAIVKIETLLNSILKETNIPINNKNLSQCSTIQGKINSKVNQGPWGWLIRDFSFENTVGIHNYLNVPGLVEDIVKFKYPNNYDSLISLFQNKTMKCVVKFKSDTLFHPKKLSKVISYLYHKVKNEEMDYRCNANFSNNGYIIKPEMILKIDYLP
ncbi:MAG: hypothetical protein NXH90_11145 [Flavobacteriaceae bacterium]|nr:hypothetical protein [Flavobacteriaceae bacterium]